MMTENAVNCETLPSVRHEKELHMPVHFHCFSSNIAQNQLNIRVRSTILLYIESTSLWFQCLSDIAETIT
jgi:hypothetical protein